MCSLNNRRICTGCKRKYLKKNTILLRIIIGKMTFAKYVCFECLKTVEIIRHEPEK